MITFTSSASSSEQKLDELTESSTYLSSTPGGLLRWLFPYEVAVLILIALGAIYTAFFELGLSGFDDWRVWTILYFCKVAWGLLMAPYLIFLAPGIGDIVTHVTVSVCPVNVCSNGPCHQGQRSW